MMQPWFTEAKLGIFIHWGIYSVGGLEASWSFFNHGRQGSAADDHLAYDAYMGQRHAFFANRYEPEAWLELFASTGARYATLTTKHHDGVALWDTAANDLSTVKATSAGRDLVAPFCAAVRRRGLQLGLYYSHLDWSHPDYPSVRHAAGCHLQPDDPAYRFSYPHGSDDPQRWARFLAFHRQQLRELCERFSPDLLWFDGDWERSQEQWSFAELREQLHAWRPGVVLNSRMGDQGDYATPEQGLPIVPPAGPWELCMTMNKSWSMAMHPSYKSEAEIVRVFADCIGSGGNLLLNVSPLGDGSIHPEQERLLRGLGRWTSRNREAIWGTTAGLPLGHTYGPSTLSTDRTCLFVTVFDRPFGEFPIKGIRNRIRRISALGHDGALPYRLSGGAAWAGIPGVLWVTVPEAVCDPCGTVLKIELEGPLDLYIGHGQVITQN